MGLTDYLKPSMYFGKSRAPKGAQGGSVAEREFQSSSFFFVPPAPEISEEESLKIPAVKSSIELITSSISQLPIYLYARNADGSVKEIEGDYRTFLLNKEANRFTTSQVLKKHIAQDMLLYGRAYLYPDQIGNLSRLPSKLVTPQFYTEDKVTISNIRYQYYGFTDTTWFEDGEVYMIDSGSNGLLIDAGELFSFALAANEYQRNILSNGAYPSGMIKATGRLTQPVIDRLRDSFEKLYQGAKKAGRTVILEEGLDFQAMQLNPQELLMTDINKFITAEVSRVFSIPQSLIDSSANKYASYDANNLNFLKSCIGPLLTAIEASLNRTLLNQTEKSLGYYFKFDEGELLRTTEQEKVAVIAEGMKNGIYSFNDARTRLDMPAEKDDFYILSTANVIRDKQTGELTNLNLVGSQNTNQGGGQPQNEVANGN